MATKGNKVVVIGDGGCGKTSLCIVFAGEEFPEVLWFCKYIEVVLATRFSLLKYTVLVLLNIFSLIVKL